MKHRITFKDPDAPYKAIRDAARDELKKITGLSDDERESLEENRHGKLSELCSEWIEYGEYVTIEIDTEAKTAVVVKVKGNK